MDPIAHLVELQGEAAVLKSPATVADFNPAAVGDYAPNAPASLNVRGVPETKIEFEVGETGAFTISVTSQPAGLKAQASTLDWRGETWRVLRIRERTWLGAINGYTLFLGV